MISFFNFDQMLTPVIIKIYLYSLHFNRFNDIYFTPLMRIVHFGYFPSNYNDILGPFFSRIICEQILVIFKIFEKVTGIEKEIKNKSP